MVPRIKSHVSPSVLSMRMRGEEMTSPLWADLVFSSEEEFDKVISGQYEYFKVIYESKNEVVVYKNCQFLDFLLKLKRVLSWANEEFDTSN